MCIISSIHMIFPSCYTRCSPRISPWTNTLNIYIIPLLHLISNSPVSFHTYADDIQLYVKCTENVNFAPDILSSTITTIHNWLTINSLVFNPIKTEAIFLHLPLRSKTLPTPPPINING